ncbi:MAG: collagen binding domain-containing protein, partial [Planctomycetota bacterium]
FSADAARWASVFLLVVVGAAVIGCSAPAPGAPPPPDNDPVPLDVRLLMADGKPMAGQVVQVRHADGSGYDLARVGEATTDADGRCRFAKVPPGRVEVLVEEDDIIPLVQRMVQPKLTPSVEIRVPAPGVFSGVLRDADGKPIAGASLSMTNTGLWFVPREELHPGGTTDADGRFRIEVRAGGWFLVSADTHANTAELMGMMWAVQVQRGDAVERDLQPSRMVQLRGTATRNGKPYNGSLTFMHIAAGRTVTRGAEADTSGHYEVILPVGDALVGCSYTMDGGRRRIRVPADAPESFDLALPYAEVAGRVVADGKPVSGLRVIARPVRAERIPRGPDELEQLFPAAVARTDDDGKYLLDGLDAGRYEIWTQPSINDSQEPRRPLICHEVTLADGDTTVQDFDLPAAHALKLRFAGVMGQPGSVGSQLDVYDADGRCLPWLIQEQYRSWAFARFELHVMPGTYSVRYQPVGGACKWITGLKVPASDSDGQLVTIVDGGCLRVHALTGGKSEPAAVWRIRDSDGRDVTPRIDYLVSSFDASRRADAGGWLQAAALAPGVYRVEVESADGKLHASVPARIRDGDTTVVEAVLE